MSSLFAENNFAAVSRCTTWSHASQKFKLLFPSGVSESREVECFVPWHVTLSCPINKGPRIGRYNDSIYFTNFWNFKKYFVIVLYNVRIHILSHKCNLKINKIFCDCLFLLVYPGQAFLMSLILHISHHRRFWWGLRFVLLVGLCTKRRPWSNSLITANLDASRFCFDWESCLSLF